MSFSGVKNGQKAKQKIEYSVKISVEPHSYSSAKS